MKTQLIKIDNKFILVSDEEIRDVRPHIGKWHLEKNSIINQFPSYLTDLSECKLIIAGIPELPSIDFSQLNEEECKRTGFVDVEKLAEKYAREQCDDLYDKESISGASWGWETALDFKTGFKISQELSDKQFSLEDMINAAKYGYEFRDTTSFPKYRFEDACINNFKQYIKSLQQPKVWDVEIEMEKQMCECAYEQEKDICIYPNCLNPKLTNNQITITKIL